MNGDGHRTDDLAVTRLSSESCLHLQRNRRSNPTSFPSVISIESLKRIIFTSRESRSILVTPSHGLFMTIYTKLTLSRDVYESFHANFRPFSGNFPFVLSSCTKGSMLIFVIRFPKTSGFRFVRCTKTFHDDFLCHAYETFRDIFRVVHEIIWEIVSFLLVSRS